MEKLYHPYKISRCFEITNLYTIHYLELNKDFYEDPEAHDFWELVYADIGKLYLETDDETIYLQEGDIYIHRPNQSHRFHGDRINASRVFIISFDCVSSEMFFFINKLFKAGREEQRLIGTIIATARETFEKTENHPEMTGLVPTEHPAAGGEQIIADCAELILLSIYSARNAEHIRPYLSKQLLEDPLVLSIVEQLESALFGEITVKEIARTANYSVSFISSYFRERTHYTISEYYNILKIEYAKNMLQESGKNIDQISRELNFCNQHYFSTIFRKYVKMTPSEYRKSVLSMGKK